MFWILTVLGQMPASFAAPVAAGAGSALLGLGVAASDDSAVALAFFFVRLADGVKSQTVADEGAWEGKPYRAKCEGI